MTKTVESNHFTKTINGVEDTLGHSMKELELQRRRFVVKFARRADADLVDSWFTECTDSIGRGYSGRSLEERTKLVHTCMRCKWIKWLRREELFKNNQARIARDVTVYDRDRSSVDEAMEKLRQVVAKMPKQRRQVFEYFMANQSKSQKRIAQELGLSYDAVRQHLCRARLIIRKHWPRE